MYTHVEWLVMFYIPSTVKDVKLGFYTVPTGN